MSFDHRELRDSLIKQAQPSNFLDVFEFAKSVQLDLLKDKKITRLQSHYNTAIQLYMHEDKLNWHKLGALLTVNIFLGAGYAYFWNNPPIIGGAYHVWGLFVLILLINWSF
ncbi:hypothetical protein, partial [Nostoc sp.]